MGLRADANHLRITRPSHVSGVLRRDLFMPTRHVVKLLILVICGFAAVSIRAPHADAWAGEPDDLATLRKSAEAGDAAAMNALGEAYDNSRGVPRDDLEAASWYRKSA